MMEILSMIAFSFAGGIIWVFNVETASVVLGAREGWHPITVGLTCATGQSLSYCFLFFCGNGIFSRWGWGKRQVERTLARYGDKLNKSFLAFTMPAALVGIPPMTGMAALSGGFQVRFVSFIAIAFAFRLIRFIILAAAGTQLMAWWSALW